MAFRFHILISDFKEYSGKTRVSVDLESYGNNLDDLLRNAMYIITDEKGFYIGDETPDEDGLKCIEDWYKTKRLRLV